MINDYLKEYQEIMDEINQQQEINRNKQLTDNELIFLIWYHGRFKKYQERLNLETVNKRFNKYRGRYISDYKIKEINKDIDILNYFVIEHMRKNNMNKDAIMVFNQIGEHRPNKNKICRNLIIDRFIYENGDKFISITKDYNDFRNDYITRENKNKFEQEYQYIWFGDKENKTHD